MAFEQRRRVLSGQGRQCCQHKLPMHGLLLRVISDGLLGNLVGDHPRATIRRAPFVDDDALGHGYQVCPAAEQNKIAQ